MVYLFLANGFEEVEALTPLDYLRRCEGISVQAVAVGTDRAVTGSHGITVLADIVIDEVALDEMEMIVLPGGMPGTLNLEASEALQHIIDVCVHRELPIGAICAAPSILGHKNLLNGKTATCYTGFEEQLFGANATGAPVEQDGLFITARGAGVANQFAFKLVEVLKGSERAQKLRDAVLWEA